MQLLRPFLAHIAAALVLVGLPASLAATGGGAAPRGATVRSPRAATPVVLTCARRDVARPTSFTTTCADGYTYFQAIKWTSWGGASAFGSARFHENPCTPTCVASREAAYAATLSLSGLTAAHGKRFYTRLHATYSVGTTRHTYNVTLSTST